MGLMDIFFPSVKETTFQRGNDGMTVTIFPPDNTTAKKYREELLAGGIDEHDVSAILNRHAALSSQEETARKELAERKASAIAAPCSSSLDCEL